MAPNTELCTAEDVAAIFGTSTATVLRWAREGKFPSITLPSGIRRFRRSDVEALLAGEQSEVPA